MSGGQDGKDDKDKKVRDLDYAEQQTRRRRATTNNFSFTREEPIADIC